MYPRDRDEIFRVLRRLWCSTSQSPISSPFTPIAICDYQYSRCVCYACGMLTRGYDCTQTESGLQIFLRHLILLHRILLDTPLHSFQFHIFLPPFVHATCVLIVLKLSRLNISIDCESAKKSALNQLTWIQDSLSLNGT